MLLKTWILCAVFALDVANAYTQSEPIYVVRMYPKRWPASQMPFYPIFQPALAMSQNFFLREAQIGQRYIHELVVADFDCSNAYAVDPVKLLNTARWIFKPKRVYRTLMIFPPCTPGLWYAGVGWIKGNFAWVQMAEKETVEGLALKISHEVAHMYGSGHALGPKGEAYGNSFSIMGGAPMTPTTRLTIVEKAEISQKLSVPLATTRVVTANSRWEISPLTTLWFEFLPKDVRVYATTPEWYDYLQLLHNKTGAFEFKGVSSWKDSTPFNVTISADFKTVVVDN